MTGILRSPSCTYKQEFQTLTCSGPFSIALRRTDSGQFHLVYMLKNFSTITVLTAFGYNWQIRAVNVAQATPPGNPKTLPYTTLSCAQSFIHLKACLKTPGFGTNRKISSVTLVPFKDLKNLSSKFFNKFLSSNVMSRGMRGTFKRATIKSNDIPLNSDLMMGTNASLTPLIFWSSGPCRIICSKVVKKPCLHDAEQPLAHRYQTIDHKFLTYKIQM